MNAIIYTSNTGYTAKYARLISDETGLPAYTLNEASEKLAENSRIIYLGWIMAGTVKGYKNASKRYCIDAVIGVGMNPSESQIKGILTANSLSCNIPLFILQGGFDMKKLRGIYRVIMKIMRKVLIKNLSKKQNCTQEENIMIDMLRNGGDRVKKENLNKFLRWYNLKRSNENA